MSGMLLSRTRDVRMPFFVEELGVHLYSGEELSYYIYHNAMLITDDFIGERLYAFIGQELGMESLEAKLRRWAESAELADLLLVILQDIHYYSSQELETFRRQMETMGKLTAAHRMKKKAEYLLKHHRYSGAVLQYDRLLQSGYPELKEKEFLGSLWMGRGMVCARQYRFSEAAENLTKAHGYCPTEDTRRMLYQLSCTDSALQIPPDILGKIPEEKKRLWEEQWNQARTQARFLGKGQEASEWMDKDNIRRAAGLQNLVENWKTEYRRSQDS